MPYYIAKIPSKLYKAEISIHPTSYSEDYREGAEQFAQTLESCRSNITTRIDDIAFIACQYKVVHAETNKEAQEKAQNFVRESQPTIYVGEM